MGKSGFTLLELSVVLVIVTLLTGSTIVLGSLRIDQARINATHQRIAMLDSALKSYATLNRRLPCPANGAYPKSHNLSGQEAANPGSCMGGAVTASWEDGQIAGGTLPVATLGLPPEAMFDGWGRKFSYAVDKRFTEAGAFDNNPQDSQCGGMTIQDSNGQPQITNGIYLMMSHGIDGHGAWLENGTVLNANVTHAASLQNISHTAAFRLQPYESHPDDPKNRYDDILFYGTRSQTVLGQDNLLRNYQVNNNVTTPGWAYIPAYTLPNGQAVPAFEVMQFEASQPRADGIPSSQRLTAPWNTVTYAQARQACQKLNEPSASANGSGSLREWDIISDSQWLSIAYQAAANSRNWEGECYGKTVLHAGHRDGSPAAAQPPGLDDRQGYAGTGNSANDPTSNNRSQRRTTYLPNGSVIWDLAGNNAEWSYCDLKNACQPGGMTDASTYTLSAINSAGNFELSGLPHLAPPNGRNSSQNTGRLQITNNSTVNGVLRGGRYNSGTDAGLFQADIGRASGDTAGFRCAKHADPEAFYPSNLNGLEIWYDASDLDGDWKEEDLLESGLDPTCVKPGLPGYSGCVRVWRNKAGNGKYHARSRRLNGAASGTESNVPSFKRSAINGRPAVNFASGAPQWLDTYHGVNNDPATDDGQGFDFANRDAFTFIIVANAQNWDAVIAGTDDVSVWWPHFVIFPFNIKHYNNNNDYVFLVDNLMSGTDAGNSFCRGNATLLAPLDLLCLADPINKVNYACAQMGGVSSPSGLTHGAPHIASGVFSKGAKEGLSAFVDGVSLDVQGSSVQPANDTIGGRQCLLASLLRFLKIKMNIGMMRGDTSTRTIGDVSEIIVFNRALNAGERRQIERYLAGKYGISYGTP